VIRPVLCAVAGLSALLYAGARPDVAASQAARPASCPLDGDFWAAHVAPAARVEVLLAAANTVPVPQRPLYARMATAAVDCAPAGARVDLYPITDVGVGRAPVFSALAPNPTSNELLNQREREGFVATGRARVDDVIGARRTFEGSDPLGTLYAAGEAIHRAPPRGRVLVIVIANGWQQTREVNLFRYNDDPSKHAGEVVTRLRADGAMPDLRGTDVAFAGVTRGDSRMKMGYREVIGLRRFWEAIVRAAGGAVVSFDEVLPGLVTPV